MISEEIRPWGRFIVLYEAEDTWLKRLIISPGQSLSYQYHENRTEVWITQDQGVGCVIDAGKRVMRPGIMYAVGAGVKHRLFNPTDAEVSVLEWATGSPTESDIIRIQDMYGRET